MIIVFVLVGAVGAALLLTLGHWYGLRRFDKDLSSAVATAEAKAREAADRQAAPNLVVHTIVLDGVSESGKTTFMLRIAFPCAEQAQLINLDATAQEYLSRPLPLCFNWRGGTPPPPTLLRTEAPEGVHALRFYDVSGERRRTHANAINTLAANGPRNGNVTALWVWDMTNESANKAHFDKDSVDYAYGSENAQLIKHIVVFLNKVDVLRESKSAAEVAELIAAEERYIHDVIAMCFDKGMPVTIKHGSSLRGEGMFEAYGALLTSLGLGEHFRMEIDKPQVVAS